MSNWNLTLREKRQGSAAQGATRDFTEAHDEAVREIKEGLREKGGNPAVSQAFSVWAERKSKTESRNIAGFEHAQMQRHGLDLHEQRLQKITSEIESNPASYPQAMSQLDEYFALAVGQGIFTPVQARQRLEEIKEQMKSNSFRSLYAQDRELAMQSMDSLGFDPNQKAEAIRRFDADEAGLLARRQADAAVKMRFLSIRQEEAEQEAGKLGDGTSLRDLAREYDSLNQKDIARELVSRADMYERNASVIQESRSMPLSELASKVFSLRETDADIDAIDETHMDAQGERQKNVRKGNSEEFRLRSMVLEERRQALLLDPAAAVMEQITAAFSAPEKKTGQEEARQLAGISPEEITAMRLALQVENAVPPARQKVLTNAEAAAYRKSWHEADPERRMLIAGEILSYGKQSGKVAEEAGFTPSERMMLARSRKDPSALAALPVILSLNAPNNGNPVRLPGMEAMERQAREESEVARCFRTAVSLLPGNRTLRHTLEDIEHTLAGIVHARNGLPTAAASLFDGEAKSLTGERMALIYDPALWPKSGALADRLTEFLLGENLEKTAKDIFSDSAEREAWLVHIRRNGIWINARDFNGYILHDPLTQEAVTDKNGIPFRVLDRGLRHND